MTTTVTITAHTWPVSIVALDTCDDGSVSATKLGAVPPNMTQQHYVHAGRQLLVTEMKLPTEGPTA